MKACFSVILNLFQDLWVQRFRNKFGMTMNVPETHGPRLDMRLKNHSLEYLFLTMLIFVPLLYQVGASYVQPTADLWVQRSVSFTTELRAGNFERTYQQYHPGVTIMWLVGTGSWIFYKVFNSQFGFVPDIFSPEIFSSYYPYAKLPLMVAIGGLVLFSYYLIKEIKNREFALLFVVILLVEPFFLASARSVHLDAMLSILMFTSALSLYYYLEKRNTRGWFYIVGFLFGLSLLTKVVALYLFPFTALVLLLRNMSWRDRALKFFGLLVISLLVFTILFPAMWPSPVNTLFRKVLYEGVFDTGIQEISRSLLIIQTLGLTYNLVAYPLTILYRLSPILLGGFVLGLVSLIYSYRQGTFHLGGGNWRRLGLGGYFLVFTFFYLLMMTFATKKIYRYVLPVFPPLALFSAFGWWWLVKLAKRYIGALLAVIIGFQVLLFVNNVPDLFAYFNPLLGGIDGASKVVSLNQDATAYDEVAKYLNLKKNAEEITVASYDWKILRLTFVGNTVSVRKEPKPLTVDYILLPIQRGHEWVTPDYELERTFRVGGVDYWYLYRRVAT